MKLVEFFKYLKQTEVISIVDEFGLYIEPVQYKNLPYTAVKDILGAEVIQVSYDHEDNSLTIEIAFDDEDD